LRNISTAATLWIIAIAAAVVLIAWLLLDVLPLIFAAVLIAAILRGLSDWTSRRTGVPRQIALAGITLLFVALLCGFAYYMGPKLITQAQQLWNGLHQQLIELRTSHNSPPWAQWLFQHLSSSSGLGDRLATSARTFVTLTADGLITFFILIVTALYFAASPELYIAGAVRVFPLGYRHRARKILSEIGTTLVLWSAGQFIDMVVVGAMTAVGLTLLGVPLAFALAILAGLLTFVPYFGAIAAGVVATMVSLTSGWHTALWVAVVFACCHVIEGYIVGPYVQRRTVRLPPALTVLSMTIVGSIFGPLGVILAAPVAAAFLVVIREAYLGDVLGDFQDVERTRS
jgi:predicted PurR-regulated permease PerM